MKTKGLLIVLISILFSVQIFPDEIQNDVALQSIISNTWSADESDIKGNVLSVQTFRFSCPEDGTVFVTLRKTDSSEMSYEYQYVIEGNGIIVFLRDKRLPAFYFGLREGKPYIEAPGTSASFKDLRITPNE